jgi:hypothetical protein
LLKLDIRKVDLIKGENDTAINFPVECFKYLIRHVYTAEQNKTGKVKGLLCTGFHEYIINDVYRIKTFCELIYQPTGDMFFLKGNNNPILYNMVFSSDLNCIINAKCERD